MEDYSQLGQIIVDSVNQGIQDKNFNLGLLLTKMEENFERLGFRKNPEDKTGVENILLVRLDSVGDFLLTIPAIREIRMNYPNAYITLVVTSAAYPVAELCPYVNEVITLDILYKAVISSNDLMQILQTATNFSEKYLWRRHYDLGFSFLSLLGGQLSFDGYFSVVL